MGVRVTVRGKEGRDGVACTILVREGSRDTVVLCFVFVHLSEHFAMAHWGSILSIYLSVCT